MTSNNATSTYTISSDPKVFDKKTESYVGKIKTNILGTIINIFGPGSSSSQYKKHKENPRELFATIHY